MAETAKAKLLRLARCVGGGRRAGEDEDQRGVGLVSCHPPPRTAGVHASAVPSPARPFALCLSARPGAVAVKDPDGAVDALPSRR